MPRTGVVILVELEEILAIIPFIPHSLFDMYLYTFYFTDQCSQVKDEGICPGNVPRIYFDQAAGRCLLFSYGGCGGNTNNFLTEDSCIATCGGPTGALIHAIQLHGNIA